MFHELCSLHCNCICEHGGLALQGVCNPRCSNTCTWLCVQMAVSSDPKWRGQNRAKRMWSRHIGDSSWLPPTSPRFRVSVLFADSAGHGLHREIVHTRVSLAACYLLVTVAPRVSCVNNDIGTCFDLAVLRSTSRDTLPYRKHLISSRAVHDLNHTV
jgi:hypothetical protein